MPINERQKAAELWLRLRNDRAEAQAKIYHYTNALSTLDRQIADVTKTLEAMVPTSRFGWFHVDHNVVIVEHTKGVRMQQLEPAA